MSRSKPSRPSCTKAAARSTSSGTASAASCCRASGSSCCSIATRRSSSCCRWPAGAPTTRSAAGSSPGSASIEGVECVISANDPTVKGGAQIADQRAQGAAGAWRSRRANRLPLINLTESGGADLPKQAEIFVPGGASVPQPHPAVARRASRPSRWCSAPRPPAARTCPGMSDYTVFVSRNGQGVPRRSAAGEDGDRRGRRRGDPRRRRDARPGLRPGATTWPSTSSTRSGSAAQIVAPPQLAQARARARRAARAARCYDPEELLGIGQRRRAGARSTCARCIARIVDGSALRGVQAAVRQPAGHAAGRRCTATRSASSPTTASCSREESQKGAQFIQLCNQRDIPLLFLQNITGFMVGTQLRAGRHHQARREAHQRGRRTRRCPHITLMVGASYGAGNYGMCGPRLRPAVRVHAGRTTASPSWARSSSPASCPSCSGRRAERAGQRVDEEADRGDARRPSRARSSSESTALFATGRLWDDGIIDPRDTRTVLGHRAVGMPLRSGEGRRRLRRLPDVSDADVAASSDCPRRQPRRDRAADHPRPRAQMGMRDGGGLLRTRRRGAASCASADVAVPLLGADRGRDVPATSARCSTRPRRTGADAIHPGYGFLSENAGVRAGRRSTPGSTWVGPDAGADRAPWRDKLEAKRWWPRRRAGPGAAELDWRRRRRPSSGAPRRRVGFPLLVKASAGGGGKGMRLVRDRDELVEAVARPRAARRPRPFGDDDGVPRALARAAPRHVEIQVLGDTHGNVVHLGRARVLDPAPPPEGHRGGAVARRSTRADASAIVRGRGRAGRAIELRRRRHRRVPGRRRASAGVLLPRDEHAAAGRAPGDREGTPGSTWSVSSSRRRDGRAARRRSS